jgi:hypothetical protein
VNSAIIESSAAFAFDHKNIAVPKISGSEQQNSRHRGGHLRRGFVHGPRLINQRLEEDAALGEIIDRFCCGSARE